MSSEDIYRPSQQSLQLNLILMAIQVAMINHTAEAAKQKGKIGLIFNYTCISYNQIKFEFKLAIAVPEMIKFRSLYIYIIYIEIL